MLEHELLIRSRQVYPNDNDLDGCEVCKSDEEIRQLKDEVLRLQAELRGCTSQPDKYVPSCRQDLQFQIDRLSEEIRRRKALLMEEMRELAKERSGCVLHRVRTIRVWLFF